MRDFKSRYPDIELEELFPHFPRMTVPEDPALSGYSWEDCHRGFIGAGGLFLVSEMARKLELKQGMRVLDLCCGNSSSSIFLAKHFRVNVIALDSDVDPTENWKRIKAAGLTNAITPMNMDARNILLPEDYFDAVFCLNSYFYFGTDDLYLPYLTRFIRAGGRIGISSPCYSEELTSETCQEFLYDPPHYAESLAVHSPKWWRRQFEASRTVQVLECEKHPQGRELWLDQVRWLVEECHPRDMEPWMREMVYREMVMLLSDRNEFVTYLTLLAVKPGESQYRFRESKGKQLDDSAGRLHQSGLAGKLQTALQDAVRNPGARFPGALLYVNSPEIGAWAGAAGLSDVEAGTAMRPDAEFRAASILKSVVAVVILQLAEEGRFSLDDPMTTVLPESVTSRFSDSDKITLRMLLNHTSGIPEWLTETMMGEIFTNPGRIWQVHEYLDVAAAQEPYFPPGEGWRYSNTDYNLLSLIVEQTTESGWREQVRERIVRPLNLANTRLPEPGDLSLSDKHAHGYFDMDSKLIDLTRIDPSMAGAAGGHALITTTADLARFIKALVAGELFENPATLDEMLTFVAVSAGAGVSRYPASYGLGIMKLLLPGDIEMLGHTGTTGGFESFVYYLPTQHLTVSGMMSCTGSDESEVLTPTLELLVPGFLSGE